jgi:hypothetical protein
MKRRLIFGVALFMSLSIMAAPAAVADNANPPKILSVVQVTKGPYKPGDVITFQINTTGGNPGLNSVVLRGGCLNWIYGSGDIRWELNSKLDPIELFGWQQYVNPGTSSTSSLIKAVVSSSCADGTYKLVDVYVGDLTQLETRFENVNDASLNYVVQGGLLVPPGIVRPEPRADSIELKSLSNTLIYAGAQMSFSLPRTSQGGQVLNWLSSGNCRVTIPFKGDVGGELTITGPGTCKLRAALRGPVDVYSAPTFVSDVTFKANNAGFEAAIFVESKEKVAEMSAEKTELGNLLSTLRSQVLALGANVGESNLMSQLKTLDRLDEQFLRTTSAGYKMVYPIIRLQARGIERDLTAIEKKFAPKPPIRNSTITCIKGKLSKKITAVNPKCPAGYKKK